jgi:flagellar motor switch protein FliM
MPLNKLCALSVGMQLQVPREAINKAELLGTGQHLVAPVRLGQLNGWRAVRLLGGSEAAQATPKTPDKVAQDAAPPPVPDGAQATRYLAPVDPGPPAPEGARDASPGPLAPKDAS